MPNSSAHAESSGNRLLDLLPPEERLGLVSQMSRKPITPHHMLVHPGEAMRQVFFPTSGVISLMTPLIEGIAIETATIGYEGMVGIHASFAGGGLGTLQALSQVSGEMWAMDVDHFRAVAAGPGKLPAVLQAYTQALFAQISQAVACNATHEIQQRTAKWLLQTHDRAKADSFELTQEFLADMLGVTRPSVTVAARTLQSAGLISYRRGGITVLDRRGLEESSCECYEAVQREYERLIDGF